jgi:TolB protein
MKRLVISGALAMLVGVGAPPALAAAPLAQNGMLLFSSTDLSADGDIFLINPDGSGLFDVTAVHPFSDQRAVFSPDGRQIAFQASTGSNFDVFVINRDGSGLRNLTASYPGDDFSPAFSPDGKRIAITRDTDPGGGALYDIVVMNGDDSNPINLT